MVRPVVRTTGGPIARRRAGRANAEREQVHQAAIKCGLLRTVIVILVGRPGLRAGQAERIAGAIQVGGIQIRIVGQQPRAESVNRRREG